MMVRALQNKPAPAGLQNHAGNPMQMAGNVVNMPPNNSNLSSDELINRTLGSWPSGINQLNRMGGAPAVPPNVQIMPWAMPYLNKG